MKMKNNLKAMLKRGEPALGAFISLPCPAIMEGAGLAGLDFAILDTEHASHNVETIENMLRTAEAYGITVIVRMTDYDHKNIGRMLDIGAHGVQVPMIGTPELASKVVRSTKFAPDGNRGISGGRGCKWGNYENYYVDSNNECVTVCMCETAEGVENIEEIVKTPLLDVIFIGTSDLSQSLGYTGQIHHPVVEAAILRIRDACVAAGVAPGIVAYTVEDAQKWIKEGFLYVAIFNDMGLFASQSAKRVKDVRAKD